MNMIIVSHDLASLDAIADHVLVLREGSAIFSGPLEELRENDDPYLRSFLNRQPGDNSKLTHTPPDPEVRAALNRWLNSGTPAQTGKG